MLSRMMKFVGLATLAVASLAVGQTQSNASQDIRAGIVILEKSGKPGAINSEPQSAGPYAWYNLQSDRQVKPVSWNIYNPNASSVLTQAMWNRWNAIDSAGTPAVGTRLTRQNAPYWEVFLNQTSDRSLAAYDVLLVNPSSYASLTPADRQRLRRFVDQGGLLWIDTGGMAAAGVGIDVINNFPYAFQNVSFAGTSQIADLTQPILSVPNALSRNDLNLLDVSIDPGGYATTSVIRSVGITATQEKTVGAMNSEFNLLQPVILWNNNANSSLSIARIGDGILVVTSRGASMKLNRPYGVAFANNVGFTGKSPILDRDGIASAKLAVNMISLLTEYRQQSGGSRKTGSSALDVKAPLIRRTFVPGTSDVAPSIFKGLVVSVVNNRVVAFDADPYRDLDGDGNPDDGMQDLRNGGSEDVVWESGPLTGPLSTPVCAEVPDSSGPHSQVLVVDGSGNLLAFNLMPKINGVFDQRPGFVDNESTIYVLAPPGGGGITGGTPFAPTVHEGVAYVSDNQTAGIGIKGRVWLVDMATGTLVQSTDPWQIGGTASSVQMPEVTAPPTIGYIPIADNSGGMDKVLYEPFASSAAGVPSAGFISIWLGAKGEKPSDYEPKPGDTGPALIVTTRAAQQGGLPIYLPATANAFGVKLSLLDANGNVMALNAKAGYFGGVGMNQVFDMASGPTDMGGGVLSFPFAAGRTSLPPQVTGIRIDYNIDLGDTASGTLGAIERGRINLPDKPGVGTRRVLGPVSLSPGGTIWVTDQQPGVGGLNRGGIYAFKEEGRGLFRMTMRWEMYQDHQIGRNGGERIPYSSTFFDDDPFRLMAFERSGGNVKFGGALTGYRVAGPVAIRNGQAFVTVGCFEQATVPVFGNVPVETTLLLAFQADQDVAQVHIGDLPDGSVILQSDVARSTSGTTPEIPSVLAGANYSYDKNTGVVRFENLTNVQKGVVQNSISLSQPILIRRPGQPDEFIEPDARSGSRWTPLLWYSAFPGLDCTQGNGPVVTGNTVYIAGKSRTPSFLNGSGFNPVGMVYALSANVAPGSPYLVSLNPAPEIASHPAMGKVRPSTPPVRPWLNQNCEFRIVTDDVSLPGATTIDANPGFLWPQVRGVTSIEDYIVRLNQTTLASGGLKSTTANGVVGGDGALIAWGNQGMYTFSQSDFLVADEGRVAQYDPSGNLLWTLTGYASGGGSGSTGAVTPVVRPTKVYRTPNGATQIVDTGANKISIVEKSGIESRGISEFRLDPNIVPIGYVTNEPLTLNGPRDVATFTTFEQRPALDAAVTRGDGEGNAAYEFWLHYLIADSGNRRLIEVVDRYSYDIVNQRIGGVINVNGEPQTGVLVWHSPPNVSGKDFEYNSVSRIWVPTSPTTGRYVFVAGVGSGLPTRVDTGLDPSTSGVELRESRTGNGGIVIFDPANPSGNLVINQLNLPGVNANVTWNDSTGSFNSPAVAPSTKLLSNVSSVTAKVVMIGSTPMIAIMVTDATGVYEALYDPSVPTVDSLNVDWVLPASAYRALRRNGAGVPIGENMPLRATFARRLDNGDILVINGYYGKRRDGKLVGGEILQLDGTPNATATISSLNYGFGVSSILFELPPLDTSRGLVIPVFADRK